MNVERPVPFPDALTAPYWAAAKERRFVLPCCSDCAQYHFYPRAVCPHCGSPRIEWKGASGKGAVYSHTTIHRAPSPAFAPAVPYVVAIVELAEGPHLMTNIVGCAPDAVRIGMEVEVSFEEAGEEAVLPVFRLAGR